MKRMRQVTWVLVLASIVISLGWRTRADYLACDKCRSRKNVTARSVFGIAVHTADQLLPSAEEMGCRHDWWLYGRTEYYGPFGIIIKSVSSTTKEFQENSNKPSDVPSEPAPGAVSSSHQG